MNCYRCGAELTILNRSPEHIIQQAIGGTIVGWELLCRPCNNIFGEEIDAPFTHFTSYLYRLALQARPTARNKDRLVGVTESGAKIGFGRDMRMDTLVQIDLADGTSVSFSAKPEDAERKALEKLQELKNERPEIDSEKVLANAVRGENVMEELVYFTNHDTKTSMNGGPSFFRGIKKIAVNFYIHKGGQQEYVQDVIEQIKQGVPAHHKISTFYYPSFPPVHKLGEEEVSHIIKLVGNPKLGLLYCYVELFNIAHSLILLNEEYDGPLIDEQYCHDVITNVDLQKPMRIPLSTRYQVLIQFIYDWPTNGHAEAAYRRTRKVLEDKLRAKGHVK